MRSRGTSRHRLIESKMCFDPLPSRVHCCSSQLSVSAQTTATVSGTIKDAGGGIMPGVTVTVSNEATGLSRTNVTGNEGRFVVAGLPPGTYDVRAEIAGFKPYRRPLTVAVADNVAVAIVLEVGGTAETVTVVDRPPVVNTSSSELSYLVSSQTIETLPLNGRNYTDLALLQPGVLAYPHRDGGSVVAHGLGISVNGQDPRANVYLARRYAAERLHQRPGRERRGHRSGNGDRARVSRRDQCLRRGIRAHRWRADQCPDEVRQQPLPGSALRIPSQRRTRRSELLRHARQARLHAEPVWRHGGRAAGREPSLLFWRHRGARRTSRQDDLDGRA